MLSVAQISEDRNIFGVDTHKDTHVAVGIDKTGRRLGELIAPASTEGYAAVEKWALSFGEIEAFGIEGTGSYGAGLCRYLQARGHRVIEVNRPDRNLRRQKGKSDSLDAESAARAVLSGTATAIPKGTDDAVEMIRLLEVARRGAMKAKTAAATTLQSMLVSLPAELREQLANPSTVKIVRVCARFRASDVSTPLTAAKMTLRSIAKRYEQLELEISALDKTLAKLVPHAAPVLTGLFGVGPGVGATLLVAAGENPERLTSEASFASLCGVSPVPASSGKTNRHRLNRGGNRQANCALHTVVLSRLSHDAATKAYMVKRLAAGKSKREVIRCLKRYVAREVYQALIGDGAHRSSQRQGAA